MAGSWPTRTARPITKNHLNSSTPNSGFGEGMVMVPGLTVCTNKGFHTVPRNQNLTRFIPLRTNIFPTVFLEVESGSFVFLVFFT